MSSSLGISESAVSYNRYAKFPERVAERQAQQTRNAAESPANAVDSAEMSDAARELAKTRAADEAGRAERRDGIRALLEKQAADRADLDAHIKAVLKKSGIGVADSQRIRLEVDSSGKIVVGGVNDRDMAKRIEEALNRELGLAKKLKQFQRESKQLSAELKRETGKSLADLVSEAKGGTDDWSKQRIMSNDHQVHDDAYFSDLNHIDLFSENPDLLGYIQDLAANTGIDIGGGDRTLSEPEHVLKEKMKEAWAKIVTAVEEYNAGVIRLTAGDSAQREEDFDDQFLISLKGASFTVDSNGGVEITGEFSTDSRTAEKARSIFQAAIDSMLEELGSDGETNLFQDATNRILENYQDAFADDAATDAVVKAQIGSKAMTGKVWISSPAKEAELKAEAADEVNGLLADMGIETPEPMQVEIDDKGRIRAVNLPENAALAQVIQHAIETINSGVEAAPDDDKRYGKLKYLLKHYRVLQPGGLSELRDNPYENMEKTQTAYTAFPLDRSGVGAAKGSSTVDLERIQAEIDSRFPKTTYPGQNTSEREYAASFAGHDNSRAVADYLENYQGIKKHKPKANASAPEDGESGEFERHSFDGALDAWLRGEGVFGFAMLGGVTADGFRIFAAGESRAILDEYRDAFRADDTTRMDAAQKKMAQLKPSDFAYQDLTGLGNLGLADRNDYLAIADALFTKAGLDVKATETRFIFNTKGEIDFSRDGGDAEPDSVQSRIQHILNNGVDAGDSEMVRRLKEYGRFAYTDRIPVINNRDLF